MAQHIPIEAFNQKVFKTIHESIKKGFKRYPLIKGSLFYELMEQDYTEDEVYLTTRYIGKGFMYNDTRGSFEIHYNKEKKRINHIYLVG
jgi:hypothetical protein